MAYFDRKNPNITEVPLELSADQQSQFAELRADIDKDASFQDVTDACLFKFLRGNSFNPQNAAKAFREYVQWRKDSKIDQILDNPVPKIDLINKLIPYAYHGFDNDGRPIYIEKTGRIATAALSDTSLITVEEFVESHKYGIELLMRRAHEESLRRGKRVDTFATVIDLTGLGMGHRQAIPILAACMGLDNKYYPERAGKLFVINAPWIAPLLYQAIQYLLDPVTKSRVHIVDGDPKLFLPTVIPRDQLPPEYGGVCMACDQAKGCVPVYESADIVKEMKSNDGFESEYITYEFTKQLECGADGATFTWFFESEGGYDIDFSIEVVAPGSAGKVFVQPVKRVVTSKGSYTSNGACKLVFKWDNSFSYFNNKTIKYLVNVAHLDMKIADQQSSASSGK